ncbi:MAG TPA: hypothetical protein VFB29_00455 [Pseudolabrys sp.]|nr:hypothetical protein [Pseudolabrys sp.]
MKMLRTIFGALFALALVSPAIAQGVGQLGAGQVWGNPTASRAIAQPSTPTSIIDRAICTTQGSILTRQAGAWVCLTPGTSGLALLSAGAGANIGYNILPLSAGGTNANLTASNGGIFYSTAAAGAILSGTATANQHLASGANSAPSWTTATYPATTLAGTMLASGSANTITATRTPTLGAVGATGTLGFSGTTSGTATITPQATAGTPTLTLPNTSGTFAVGATSPLALSATTGGLTCTTCATTTNGGALSGTAPVAISAGGAISITGAAGQVLAGASPAFTATPTLGASGTLGSVTMGNATSGLLTVQPVTGALGSNTLSLPAVTDTVVARTTTDTLTNKTVSAGIFTGLEDHQGAVKFSTQSQPAQITVDQNDYNPSSVVCSTTTTLLINSNAARNITGLAGPASGCEMALINNGAFTITLKEQSASSAAANRFNTGGDISLVPSGGVLLRYDGNASRWRLVGTSSASGGGSGTVTSVTCGNTVITSSGTCIQDPGYGYQNCGFAISAAASALTIALKDAAGNDPTASSPCAIFFRSATGTTGTVTVRYVTAATSLVVSSGSTLGVTSATAFRLWIGATDDAGTVRLWVINTLSGTNIYPLGASDIISSTAEGGAGAADSAQVFYTGTAVTSKASRTMGYIEWNTSGVTAGTWTTTNLIRVQMYGIGIPLPGQRIQSVRNITSSAATNSTDIPFDDTIPQITEGGEVLTQAITPTSAANILEVHAQASAAVSSGSRVTCALFNTTYDASNALTAIAQESGTATANRIFTVRYWVKAATTSSSTWRVRIGNNAAATTTFNGDTGVRKLGGVMNSFLEVWEIMSSLEPANDNAKILAVG